MNKLLLILIAFFFFVFACTESNQKANPEGTESEVLLNNSIKELIHFFDTFAYQAQAGVYLSEIDNQGKVRSNKVFNVALSRLVYGLSYSSSIDEAYLERAKESSEFQIKYLTNRDSVGNYFSSFYDLKAEQADSATTFDIWQQAYGLCGLTELYRHNRDKDLLAKIHDYHESFIRRFHDKTHGGFYGNYDISKGQVSGSKSLQSLMYPITAYMENLWRADIENRSKYESHLRENLEIIVQHAWNKDLGWVNVKLNDDWSPCAHESAESPCFTVTPGHNFQLASLFLRTKDWTFLSAEEKERYHALGLEILEVTLTKPAILNPDLSEGFYSEINPVNDSIIDNRKTWWQHCEALLSLSLANDTYNQEIDNLKKFYFDHFPDKEFGGEYFYIDHTNKPETTTPKGSIGKSIYHTTEMVRFLKNKAS